MQNYNLESEWCFLKLGLRCGLRVLHAKAPREAELLCEAHQQVAARLVDDVPLPSELLLRARVFDSTLTNAILERTGR
jgi:hypothetical protein